MIWDVSIETEGDEVAERRLWKGWMVVRLVARRDCLECGLDVRCQHYWS